MPSKKRAKKDAPKPFELFLDEKHPANLQVLASLGSGRAKKWKPIAAPAKVPDPYMNCGSHPDIVERVWDHLGRVLPDDGRCLVYGNPALVHPRSGVVLAVCYGTSYALRLPKGSPRPPRRLRVVKWTLGGETDLEAEYGKYWQFGCFSADEENTLKAVYEEFVSPRQPDTE
jgi:hypothetical protein